MRVLKCSDEDLILLLVDKTKLFRDFRAESQQTLPICISVDSKKRKQIMALKYIILCLS